MPALHKLPVVVISLAEDLGCSSYPSCRSPSQLRMLSPRPICGRDDPYPMIVRHSVCSHPASKPRHVQDEGEINQGDSCQKLSLGSLMA